MPPLATAAAPDPRQGAVIRIASVTRFAEAIAVGMLIPVLPVFLRELDRPWVDRVQVWLTPHVHSWLADWPTLSGLLPPREEALLGPEQLTAILFSLTAFGMAGIQIVSGRLSDAWDTRKPIILFGMAAGACCSGGYAAVDTYGGLLAIRLLQGLAMGLTFPPLMAIIARHSPRGRGGRTLGVYSTIRLLGFACGPLVGGFVTEAGGHGATFITSALLLALSWGAVALFLPDSRERSRPPTASRDTSGESGASPHPAREPRPPVPFTLRILGGAIFVMMVGISGIISLFPAYQEQFGASERQLGLVFSAFIGTRFLLQYPLGSLGDRLDKKWVLLVALLLLAPLVALQGRIGSLGELVLLRIALGAVAAAISSSVSGMAAERSSAGNRARVMGTNTFSFSLGVAIGPLVTGFIDDPAIAFLIPGACALSVAVAVAVLVPSDRGVARREEQLALVEPDA